MNIEIANKSIKAVLHYWPLDDVHNIFEKKVKKTKETLKRSAKGTGIFGIRVATFLNLPREKEVRQFAIGDLGLCEVHKTWGRNASYTGIFVGILKESSRSTFLFSKLYSELF
jgi:hypothetical protein